MVGYVIGTGSVTTMASAGASYGMALTWTLVLASLFTHIMFCAVSKMVMVSGRTMLSNFRRHFGGPVTVLIMVAMAGTQIASVVGVMGIITDVVKEWSGPFTPGGAGISRLASGVAFVGILLWLFWNGRHRLFLKAVSFLVALMGISFVATSAVKPPPVSSLLRGLVPSIPEAGAPHLLIAGMVGTTLASVCLFARSIVIHEEAWQPGQIRLAYRDSLVSAVLLLLINTAVMACAAGTLYLQHTPVERAIDMVKTLEPIAGRFAVTMFVVGIVGAGLSSLFPNYILGPWMLSDYFGWPRDLQRTGYRAMVAATALCSLTVPLVGGSPVRIMIASQALSPLIMPLITLFTWRLLCKKEFTEVRPNSIWMTVGLAATLLFTLAMLVVAAIGFLNTARGG